MADIQIHTSNQIGRSAITPKSEMGEEWMLNTRETTATFYIDNEQLPKLKNLIKAANLTFIHLWD